jgi:hypothetical protein
METLSFVFLISIVSYMLCGLLVKRARKKTVKKTKIGGEKKMSVVEETGNEQAALAAVLAAVMGNTAYVIKRVYAIPAVDEKKSSWCFAGRQEMMTIKNTLK